MINSAQIRLLAFVRAIFLTFIMALSGVLLAPSGVAHADESQPTQVTVRSWLGSNSLGSKPTDELQVFAPTQQIILNIEVSTNTWYTAGTKISALEIPDVLVKRRNPFAVNSTVREKGQTWSRQLWEVVLYPQKSGDFTVPAVSLDVQVSGSNGEKQQVKLATPPQKFRVEIPSAELGGTQSWFAASDVTVKQEWQASSENPKVGDAITRVIEIQAQDSLSVLLPTMMTNSVNDAWQGYLNPPELVDTQSRDGYISKRKDSLTYVFQQGGDIHWPSIEIWWWNTKAQSLEKITIEGYSVHVKHTIASWLKDYRYVLISSLISALVLVFIVFATRRYYRTHPSPQWVSYYLAVLKGRWPVARTLLYKKVRSTTGNIVMNETLQSKKLQDKALLMQKQEPNRRLMTQLWRNIKRKAKRENFISKALPELDSINK
ncbi:BatD family protein [Vibrio ziniensis]|uniref:Protein BatD n=1 Tax=Vibrio ziniensis TaxID=2711221 RepID=A0A6G7CMW8_9VIBR|nr:BatD family protein [Vibrio ziniensis]QIH43396.1 protein BatD [Vibrio ziniensis]